MAQHDYNVVNGSGQQVRDDINGVLQAILTHNSGTEPGIKYEGTLWFDDTDTTKPGILKVYDASGNWQALQTGDYLPLAGGNIIGDLTVNGTFSNPDYDKARASYVGTTAPANPLPGMQWYDTTVAASPVLKTRTTNNTWVEAAPVNTPSFQNNLNVVSATTVAEVRFTASAESRRLYNDATNKQIRLLNPAGTLVTAISDTGDWWLPVLGWIGGAINAKQANLGFTPLWQTGANVIMIGHTSMQLWVDGVGRGVIGIGNTGAVTIFARGDLGSTCRCHANGGPWPAPNDVVPGTNLTYGQTGSTVVNVGSWRNMGGQHRSTSNGSYLRIA